jgi:hypothetical protein
VVACDEARRFFIVHNLPPLLLLCSRDTFPRLNSSPFFDRKTPTGLLEIGLKQAIPLSYLCQGPTLNPLLDRCETEIRAQYPQEHAFAVKDKAFRLAVERKMYRLLHSTLLTNRSGEKDYRLSTILSKILVSDKGIPTTKKSVHPTLEQGLNRSLMQRRTFPNHRGQGTGNVKLSLGVFDCPAYRPIPRLDSKA